MGVWAIDLGTTNTGVARWDEMAQRPRLVELSEICRHPGRDDPLEAPRMVPSTTHVLPIQSFKQRFGALPLVERYFFLGRRALIGRPALEENQGTYSAAYASTFKPYLGHEPLRTLARTAGQRYSARDVAAVFLRELLVEIKAQTNERVRDLVITTPVEAYEHYRAELQRIVKRLGIRHLRFVDEPVAASIGYGLSMDRERNVLVVDFGGGTLDIALVGITPRGTSEGACAVRGKEGRPIGGNLIDQWLLEDFCRRADYPLRTDSSDPDQQFWYGMMLAEACRVKESVFFNDQEIFLITPPDHMRHFEARLRNKDEVEVEITRDDLTDLLTERGLYDAVTSCLDGAVQQAARDGITEDEIDDVLMVGGSTLLPGVFGIFEERFGRDRVRAWQPFEAVAYGAGAFAAESFVQSDFIVHDYAILTYNSETHDPEHTVVIPSGTRFPTTKDFWKRQLTPTCSLGEPETIFKLVICEIGKKRGGDRQFGFDERGRLKKLAGEDQLVVPLNENNPTLGYLNPPHSPRDRRARLEISFGVNSDRWLCTTVYDLFTRKRLMDHEPVVRLL